MSSDINVSDQRSLPAWRPVYGYGLPVPNVTRESCGSTAGSDHTVAPATAASAGFDQVRMNGSWFGSGVVYDRQISLPDLALYASRWPRIGLSPPFGAVNSIPSLPSS